MRPTSTWLLTLTLLWAAAPTTPASAEDAITDVSETAEVEAPVAAAVIQEEPDVGSRDALVYNAEILDELLERSTKETIKEQKFAAAAGILGGGILLGVGSWRLIENEPDSQYSRGLGVMFMTLGMVDLTAGVFAMTRVAHEKRRLDRWERVREDGITELELAHFEGELQAAHETREGERLLVRWVSFTHALAGLLVLAYTPIPDGMTQRDRVSGYVIGAIFTVAGTATFAASFRKTPSEKAWEQYNMRKIPTPGHEFTWGVAPSISRRGAGLSFGGTF
ncbi:MAG: hypothetical protein JRI98_04725 [Deltaproteobacteria bacterium]|nr:hypothetical protein [Deltaproteobacteria bacterium]MBW2380230.1 hypothetical protein [Deltaproteobacteria bacterium]